MCLTGQISGIARGCQRNRNNRHLKHKIFVAWISDMQWMSLPQCFCHFLRPWHIPEGLEEGWTSWQQGRDDSGTHRFVGIKRTQGWLLQLPPRLPQQHFGLGVKWSPWLTMFSLWVVQQFPAQLARPQQIPLQVFNSPCALPRESDRVEPGHTALGIPLGIGSSGSYIVVFYQVISKSIKISVLPSSGCLDLSFKRAVGSWTTYGLQCFSSITLCCAEDSTSVYKVFKGGGIWELAWKASCMLLSSISFCRLQKVL